MEELSKYVGKRVSDITFIGYAQCQKIGKSIKLSFFLEEKYKLKCKARKPESTRVILPKRGDH